MIPLIEEHRDAIHALCRRYQVAKLELFGSAASGEFDSEASDIDLLVEFLWDPAIEAADQYFGLLFSLEELLGRRVDLVCANAMRNPYFIRSVNETRQVLYAA